MRTDRTRSRWPAESGGPARVIALITRRCAIDSEAAVLHDTLHRSGGRYPPLRAEVAPRGAGLKCSGALGGSAGGNGRGSKSRGLRGGADLGSGEPQIPCRGGQTSMPHEQLDGAYVRAVLEQVAGEGMSQGVRCHRLGEAAAFGAQLAGVRNSGPGHVGTGDYAPETTMALASPRGTNRVGSPRS